MDILLSADNNYVMPTGVLMHSICINNSGEGSFHVMVNESFSKDSEKAITGIARQYGKDIHYYVITDETTKDLPFGKADMPTHVSIATYYRLFITKILPNEVHRIIYLDGDMIVRHSLKELWETDIYNYAIAVVHDQDEKTHILSKRLPYPMETGYFNAGMQLINVDYWRKHDCFSLFMKFINEHRECIKYHDQDVMNAVLYNRKKWVSTKYNFQYGFLLDDDYGYIDEIKSEVYETMPDPVIIHYCTKEKPWRYLSTSPYTGVWRYYRRKSQWRNQKLEGDSFKSLKQRLIYFMIQYNLWLCKHNLMRKSLWK